MVDGDDLTYTREFGDGYPVRYQAASTSIVVHLVTGTCLDVLIMTS